MLKQPSVWAVALLFLLFALELVWWLGTGQHIPLSLTGSPLYPALLLLAAYLLAFAKSDHFRNFRALLVIACFGIGLTSMFLLSRRTQLYVDLSLEDRSVESVSAGALFVGAVAFGILAAGHLRRKAWPLGVITAVFAVVLFVMGMEEISWMQRILDIESSQIFVDNNSQAETNLHNFNTGLSEKLLYFGGFGLLILMPFFREPLADFARQKGWGDYTALLPAQWLYLPASVMVGYVGSSVLRDPSAAIALIVAAFILGRIAVDRLATRDVLGCLVHCAFLVLIVVMAYYFTTYNYADSGMRILASRRKEYLELVCCLGLMSWAISAVRETLLTSRPSGLTEPRPSAR